MVVGRAGPANASVALSMAITAAHAATIMLPLATSSLELLFLPAVQLLHAAAHAVTIMLSASSFSFSCWSKLIMPCKQQARYK
jgi:hypothetical protein